MKVCVVDDSGDGFVDAAREAFRGTSVCCVAAPLDCPVFVRRGIALAHPCAPGVPGGPGPALFGGALDRVRARLLDDGRPLLPGSALAGASDDGDRLLVACPVAVDRPSAYASFLAALCLVEKLEQCRGGPPVVLVCPSFARPGLPPRRAAAQVYEAYRDFSAGARPGQTAWKAVPDAFVT